MQKMRPTLYGSMADCSKIIGFCYRHKTGITVKQLKRKHCLAKQCNAFKRYEDHPYWQQRKAAKNTKKENRLYESIQRFK